MPKQVADIFNFGKGIFGNTPVRHVPEGYCAYSENLDSKPRGLVKGVKGTSEESSSFAARIIEYFNGDGDNLVLGQDSSKQVKKYDIAAGTESNIGSATDNFISSITPHNKEAYCGTVSSFRGDTPTEPIWIGYINHGQFGGSAPSGLQITESNCRSFAEDQTDESSTSPLFSLNDHPSEASNDEVGEEHGSGTVFKSSKKYYYGISLVYDGYQESPLIKGSADSDGELDIYYEVVLGSDSSFIDLCIRIAESTSGDIPERISAVNLYRAESASTEDVPTSAYRLVESIEIEQSGTSSDYESFVDIDIDLNGAINSTQTTIDIAAGGSNRPQVDDIIKFDDEKMKITGVDTGANTIDVTRGYEDTTAASHADTTDGLIAFDRIIESDGDNFPSGYSGSMYFVRIKDEGESGPSFEDNTGIPDTLESNNIKYKLSDSVNNQLFTGLCESDEITEDVSNYIFVSAPGRFGIFNWAEDFIKLPEKPVALQGFRGKMFAFSNSNTYILNSNPRLFSIDNTIHGYGCLNEHCVVSTEYGLFHADKDNIYLNNGGKVTPIGDPILELQSSNANAAGWHDATKEDSGNDIYPFLAFDSNNNRLLVFFARSSGTGDVWAFNIRKERWDYYPGYGEGYNAALSKDGSVYFAGNEATPSLHKVYGGSLKDWKIETKQYSPNEDSGYTYFYDITSKCSGSPTIKYSVDGGSLVSPGTSDDDGQRKATVNSGDKKSKGLSVMLESGSGSDEAESLTFQFRPQAVKK